MLIINMTVVLDKNNFQLYLIDQPKVGRCTVFFSSPTDAQLSERFKKISLNFSIGCSIFYHVKYA